VRAHLRLHLVYLVDRAKLPALPYQHHDVTFEGADAEDVDDTPRLPRLLQPYRVTLAQLVFVYEPQSFLPSLDA
jgi:hypothetical protein